MGDDLDDYLRGALALAGMQVSEDELALVRMLHEAMAPQIEALLAAGMLNQPIEYDLDPSRAPQP